MIKKGLILLVLMLALTSCSFLETPPEKLAAKGLGISTFGRKVTVYTDDHGGFVGDGATHTVLEFKNGKDTPILDRSSYNFTLDVYDASEKVLHYFEIDT